MAEWEKLDVKEAVEVLGTEGVKKAQEHAAESVARSRILYRSRIPTGRLLVTRGPIMPVPGEDGKPMPVSAVPLSYMILWYGNPGADYPAEVDENVLMRMNGRTKGQVWSVQTVADVRRILKAAFGISVPLPPEEPKS